MATTVVAFSCSTPAGGTSSISLSVGTDPVEAIRWRVPPGPRGALSWYLAQSGVQVLPSTLGAAIVADDEWDTWVLSSLPPNPIWTFVGTNTGVKPHSVYLQFFTNSAAASGGGGGVIVVDDTSGFPTSDAQLAGMWLT